MNARHVATLQTALRTKVPVSAGTYEGNVIVASSGTGDARNICVWYVFAEDKQVLTLKGHSSILKSLALSPPGSRCLLCSVAEDSAILWDIGECYSRNSAAKMQQQVVLTSLSKETAGSASFNDTSSLVAVCRGCDVLVFTTKLDTTLVGHSAPVTGAVFSTRHSNLIITISEDRTFKIWDLVQSSVAFQSAIISASVFVSACMDPVQDHLFTMAADGKLRVYDMVLGNGHTKLQECDVGKEQEKMASHVHFEGGNASNNDSVIRSMVSRQPPSDAAPSTNPCAHAGPLVIGMYYLQGKHGQEGDEELPGALPSVSVSSISQVLSVPSRLLVVTSLGALCLNANTLETLSYLDFREPLPSVSTSDVSFVIPAAACCDVITSPQGDELSCVLGSMFDGSVSVLSIGIGDCEETADIGDAISVLASTPLSANSLLKAELTMKHPTPVPAKKPATVRGKPLGIVDKPLTFKSKVKSSGYSEQPRTKMFTPKTQKSAQKLSIGKSNCTKGISSESEYSSTAAPPTEFAYSSQLSERPMAVNGLSFSGTGSHLSCACSDGTVRVLRPLPQGSLPQEGSRRECTFVGHDGTVYSSSWSHDGRWLLTCSADQTARLWTQGRQEPLMVFNSTLHNFKSDSTTERTNTLFTKEVTSAQFYYLDRFIVLSAGNSFYLYKYHIDTAKMDDIKRYLSASHYKLVKEFVMSTAQKITAVSAVNEFHSYIALIAGSNKTLEVHDLNVGQCVCAIEDVHSRPVNCIAQNKGSRYVTHPPHGYDLFLTSAVADGVKLWDLRTRRCVSRFTAHKNPSLPLPVTFSPCARYISTGSEDRCAYIYDIRSPAPLHKLSGHSDVVSAVAFHPSRIMLSTGTLSGEIKYFVNPRTS